MLGIALILVAIGYLVATQLDFSWLLPVQASFQSVLIDRLFRLMMGIAVVIFLLVEGLLIFAIFRFRYKQGDETDAAPVHGNIGLEVVWTLIPAIIVVVIGVYSFQVLTDVERPGEQPLVIEVIGRQYVWEFRYPQSNVSSPILHLPVAREVKLQLTSEDVIHSFWVPEFRVKRDTTPGRISELVLRPIKIGEYPVLCAELCGAAHAEMVSRVIVEDQSDFDAWIADQIAEKAAPEMTVVPDTLEEGRKIYIKLGCGACHILEDAESAGVLGSSLEGYGLVAPTRVEGLDARTYTLQAILQPNAFIVEGYGAGLMPANYGDQLTEGELEILIDYLLEQ
jgi:cytochrome c oxidase subunit 2